MSPVELVLFGALCYAFGFVPGALVILWLVDHGLFRVIASPDQTITCRDYRGHQGEAHARTPDGWVCSICSAEGAGS